MKRIVLGSIALVVAVVAVGAGLAAQGGANTEQTIMGCVKGDGSDAPLDVDWRRHSTTASASTTRRPWRRTRWTWRRTRRRTPSSGWRT